MDASTRGAGPPSGDWAAMREWCVWYLQTFLEWARKPGAEYSEFDAALQARPLKWRQVRRIADENVRSIVMTITGSVSETASFRGAIPAEFDDGVTVAERWLPALEAGGSPEDVVRTVERIEYEVDTQG